MNVFRLAVQDIKIIMRRINYRKEYESVNSDVYARDEKKKPPNIHGIIQKQKQNA